MPIFSKTSLRKLATCSPLLEEIAQEAIRVVDFSVIWGHRNKRDQDKAFKDGFSEKKWPFSKHNEWPSRAMDIIPYPVKEKWEEDRDKFFFLAGIVIGIALKMKVEVRWGGDWDRNPSTKEKFEDLAHFELLD